MHQKRRHENKIYHIYSFNKFAIIRRAIKSAAKLNFEYLESREFILLAIWAQYTCQEIKIILLKSMSTSASFNFEKQSPHKIYSEAQKFTKTLGHRFGDTALPSSKTKQTYLKNLAEDKTDDVRFTIEQAKYQNQLYRRLEAADMTQRQSFSKEIEQKNKKIEQNILGLRKKEEKEIEVMNKHLDEVYKKHRQIQINSKRQKDEEAIKLRRSLNEFYKKEKHRKKQADARQISVSTCYQDAVNRLQELHRKNEEYSLKTERQHSDRMNRNSGKQKNLLVRSRLQSAENKKKVSVYLNNCQILQEKQHCYIQTYGKDLDTAEKCFKHKQKEVGKKKEQIHKFIKERVQKWSEQKSRVDDQKSVVNTRCLSIMENTTKASFRQTVSSFKDSSRNWHSLVRENKSMIYERDEAVKDQIMQTHLDMRLRNTNSFRVQEKIGSMRNKAQKIAHEYL